jgi:hypothetical protein
MLFYIKSWCIFFLFQLVSVFVFYNYFGCSPVAVKIKLCEVMLELVSTIERCNNVRTVISYFTLASSLIYNDLCYLQWQILKLLFL